LDGLIDNEYNLGREVWVCLGDSVIDQMVGGEVVGHVQDGAKTFCRFSPDHAADLVEVSEHVQGFVRGVGTHHICRRQLVGFNVGERCYRYSALRLAMRLSEPYVLSP
jgi:hypothetical protein